MRFDYPRPSDPRPEIYKVQLSLDTSCDRQQVLIYNEDLSQEWKGDADDAIKKRMKGLDKAFFLGHLMEDGKIYLGDKIPDQEW